MAITSSSLHFMMIPTAQLKKKKKTTTTFGVYMLHQNGQNQPVRIKSYDFTRKIVFEDESRGIVCYKDENEELICEGYDEGPRMIQQPSHNVTCLWNKDLDIYELISSVRNVKQSNPMVVTNGIKAENVW